MNITEIRLKNFLSHKDSKLRFKSNGLLGVVGENGTGKSALVKDAVTWALWGRSRTGGAGDDLIHWDEPSCCVSVRLTINNKFYIVTRERKREAKTKLYLKRIETNGELFDESKMVLKDTQQEINKILGMSYDVFRNSCCIEQGDANSFSKLSPKEAGILILRILQLDNYSRYKIKATDNFVSCKLEADKLELANSYLDEKLKSIKDVNKTKQKKSQELKYKEKEHKSLESKYEKAEKQYSNIYRKWQQVNIKIKEFNVDLANLDRSLTKLSKQVETLDKINGKCPICDTHLKEDKKQQIKENFLREYQSLLDRKTQLENHVESHTERLNKDQKSLESFNLRELRDSLTTSLSDISGLKGEVDSLSRNVVSLKETQSKRDDNTKLLTSLRANEEVYSELATAFGPRGIPLLIVDNVLRELEVLINNYINLLSDLSIILELHTQRESTVGDLIDTFQIMINDGLNCRPYFNYSGGERMIIDLALRLGLSELLARRNNFKVETLIIDEGLGSLDDANQRNLMKTLFNLTSKFKKIIVITHTQAKDYFTDFLSIVKKDKISFIDNFGNMCYNDNGGHVYEKTHKE